MEKELQELLKSDLLNEDVQKTLQEALVKKLEEAKQQAREEVELTVREEYARRYAEAKEELIDATEKLVTESVGTFLKEGAEERKALQEEKQKLSKAIREARADYKSKLDAHKKMLETFVLDVLKKEVGELSQDHRDVAIQKVKLQKEISEAKTQYNAKLREHLDMMNTVIASKLKAELSELAEDHKEIIANKIKLQETIEQAKVDSAKKLKEQSEVMKNFVLTQLREEMTKLRSERIALQEKKVETVSMLREHRETLNETYKGRLTKLEGFVVEQLTKELAELEKDRQELAEARVKLYAESKAKLLETQKEFIARATTVIEKQVETQLRKEFTEMREDIMEARRNNFGRKIFEAVASEFMVSFYSESKEIKKLNEALAAKEAMLSEAQAKVNEKQRIVESAARKIKLAEDKATRVVELNRLLAPLDKSKRKVMEGLLETVKTEALKESFDRYLPHVMAGTTKPAAPVAPQPARSGVALLNENKPVNVTEKKKSVIEVTGNKTNNKLAESVKAEEAQTDNAEIFNLRRLAGIVD